MGIEDLPKILRAAEELAKLYLSDISRLPIIDGQIAFFDWGVLTHYQKAHRYRPANHLINYSLWDVHFDIVDGKIEHTVTNLKTVSGNQEWNLAELLSKGTHEYTSIGRMGFFDRYRNKWHFAFRRKGIRSKFVSGWNAFVDNACNDALEKVMVEYSKGRI
jgi:hypothetical protein